jgi:hypothetical protein
MAETCKAKTVEIYSIYAGIMSTEHTINRQKSFNSLLFFWRGIDWLMWHGIQWNHEGTEKNYRTATDSRWRGKLGNAEWDLYTCMPVIIFFVAYINSINYLEAISQSSIQTAIRYGCSFCVCVKSSHERIAKTMRKL